MLRFVDVSNWQRGMDLAAVVRGGGLAGAIVKATEGVGYVDPSCDGFVRQLRASGALFGYYHFARNNDAAAEADFFRKNTIGYEGAGIPVLDWEDGQTVAWVNRFVERYHELTGVWPWVYANPWRFRQGAVNPNCGRWVAGYPRTGITDIDYGMETALPSSYDVGGVCAWQFSSSVRIAGYNGNLDGDVFYGDEEAWMAYAGGSSGARLGFADAAAEVMEHLCEHSAHGYSQVNRQGVGTGANIFETVALSDGTKVTIAQGDRDCSSAAIECYAALGVDCGGASYTGNMRSLMTKTGNFKWITDLSQRRRGDILLNEAHHTAVYLGGGRLGQFSISERGTTHGTRGDQTGYESNVKAYYSYPWNGILRYCGPARKGSGASSASKPSSGGSKPKWQTAYGDPEWWGPKMAKAFVTQLLGGTDDFLSGQSTKDQYAFWAVSGGVEYGAGGSDTIRVLQRKLGVKADGYYGEKTILAHQKWLKKKGYYTGALDGYHGHETNAAVCKALADGAYKKL